MKIVVGGQHKRRNLIVLILIILVVLIGWIFWTNMHFTSTHLSIINDKIPKDFYGYKIAVVSDLHNHDWNGKLTEQLQKEAPDIIVITGDFVDSSHTDFGVAKKFIYEARDIAPIYYVTGNHEAWLDNNDDLHKLLLDAGVHIMDDKCELIKKGNSNINIIGIQDPDFVERDTMGGIQGAIVETKMEPLLDKKMYNIVLCHRPELFDNYVALGADLVLAGHAHGGQIRIPFIGGLIAPNQGFFPKYTEGVYHKEKTDMVVSRGLGNSIIPVRINNTPELLIVTLGK